MCKSIDRNDYPPEKNMSMPTRLRKTSIILTQRPRQPVTRTSLACNHTHEGVTSQAPTTTTMINTHKGNHRLRPGYHSPISNRARHDPLIMDHVVPRQ
jgi:hypothetical protein